MKSISAYAADTLQATVAKNLFETHYRQFGPLHEPFRAILCDRIARVTSVAAHDTATIAYLVNGSKTVTLYTKTKAASAALTASATTIDAGTVVNIPSYNGRTFTFDPTAEDHVVYIGETSYVVADAGDAAANGAAIVIAINAGTQAIASGTTTVTITYLENTRALPPMVISDADGTPATVAVTIASGDAVPVQYVVAATTAAAATYTLDEPWQGPSGYVYIGTTAATNIGESTLNAANAWGLKFTGVMEPFNPVTGKWTMVRFDVLGGAFGSFGTEYKAVKANEGHGNWRAVATLEQYAQGNETFYRTSNYPYTPNRTEAVAGTGGLGYDVITAIFKKSVDFAASGVTVSSPFTLVLAFRSGLSYDSIDTPL